MTPTYCAIIIGGPMALFTLHRGIRVLADRIDRRRLRGQCREYVPEYRRSYLLNIPPAAEAGDDVVHGVSDWQVVLDTLRIKPPRALCGESLVVADDGASPSRNLFAPACPRCAVRAPWIAAGA